MRARDLSEAPGTLAQQPKSSNITDPTQSPSNRQPNLIVVCVCVSLSPIEQEEAPMRGCSQAEAWRHGGTSSPAAATAGGRQWINSPKKNLLDFPYKISVMTTLQYLPINLVMCTKKLFYAQEYNSVTVCPCVYIDMQKQSPAPVGLAGGRDSQLLGVFMKKFIVELSVGNILNISVQKGKTIYASVLERFIHESYNSFFFMLQTLNVKFHKAGHQQQGVPYHQP